jgi:probable F420-dependent oxidoreductase
MDLGRTGIWWSGSWRDKSGGSAVDVAAELEVLGYTALWSSGRFGPGLSEHFERLLASTNHIAVASGIVSIWHASPAETAAATRDLEDRYPGRFLLGLGASHAAAVDNYSRPYSHMVAYLDSLDDLHTPDGPDGVNSPDRGAAPSSKSRRVLAALGPRMLELARDRALGAHPYFVTAEHTARARSVLGPNALLAPEVTVVLESDPQKAREMARTFTAGYLGLPNYVRNLRTLGFDDHDVAVPGSDRLVDAIVYWGDVGTITSKVQAHFDAGADHVCIQVVSGDMGSFPIAEYRELAPALISQST